MPKRDPKDPRQFSESFEFIQSLFQQPESKTVRIPALFRLIFKGLTILVTLLALLILGWLLVSFQISQAELSDAGLWLPAR